MRLTLISPRIAVQKGDFLGSGIPYWPIELATLAAFLEERGDQVDVIDLLGAAPGRLAEMGDYFLQGAPLDAYLDSPAVRESEGFILFALSYMSHRELLGMAQALKAACPTVPVAVLENSQAVTAYSIPRLAAGFFAAGVDALLCGEPYFNWNEIADCLHRLDPATAPDNVVLRDHPGDRPVRRRTVKQARYPVPAWDKFNTEGYWSLPYSHGPKSGRYLPILTSRGCPYPCDFCVVPETNDRRWRGNAAADVVDEMIALRDRHGVRHFQIEDLNPTVKSSRWDTVASLLLERDAGIRFYIVSGTKAETVPVEQVPLLARAGCRYLSISPESGSSDVMKVIGKRFDYDHGLRLIAACRANGIRTQACFLVGHPAETAEDFRQSHRYMRALIRAGLDEVAVFIVAPFAGSSLFAANRISVADENALASFSPKGRQDYPVVARRRQQLIRLFFVEKLKTGVGLWAQGLRALFGRPQTKIENLPRRVAYVYWMIVKLRVRTLLGAAAHRL